MLKPLSHSETPRFLALDGLRGIAAIFVALYHLPFSYHLVSLSFLRNSWIFVDVFFVLSGFVITHNYFGKIGNLNETAVFAIRRFGRLWPLHAALLVVFVALATIKLLVSYWGGVLVNYEAFGDTRGYISIMMNALLFHGLWSDYNVWNYPSWSISSEFWTYLVFAGFCILTSRKSAMIAGPLIAVLAAIVCVSCADSLETSPGLLRCIFGFFVGYTAHRLYSSNLVNMANGHPHYRKYIELATISLTLLCVAYVGSTLWSFVAPCVFGLTVFVFAHELGFVSLILKGRTIQLVGTLSYSIYMIHAVFVLVVLSSVALVEQHRGISLRNNGLIDFGSPWLMDVAAVVYLISVVGAAVATYRFIEQPAYQLFNSVRRYSSVVGARRAA
jgi:peptidoglycan/LPS O-acetylase OafA/YrhL